MTTDDYRAASPHVRGCARNVPIWDGFSITESHEDENRSGRAYVRPNTRPDLRISTPGPRIAPPVNAGSASASASAKRNRGKRRGTESINALTCAYIQGECSR
jgi:hypothetical protein